MTKEKLLEAGVCLTLAIMLLEQGEETEEKTLAKNMVISAMSELLKSNQVTMDEIKEETKNQFVAHMLLDLLGNATSPFSAN